MYHHSLDQGSQINRQQNLGIRNHNGNPIISDYICHQSEYAERSHFQHHIHDALHPVCQNVKYSDYLLSPLPKLGQGIGKNQRKHNYLDQLVC